MVNIHFTKSGEKQVEPAVNDMENRESRREIIRLNEENDRLQQQLEIIQKNQELKAVDACGREMCPEAVRLKEIVMSSAKEIALLKFDLRANTENFWSMLTHERQTRNELKRRIHALEQELIKQRAVVHELDSPMHRQDGPTCMNYAAATWIRRTLKRQTLQNVPDHDEIVQNIPKSPRTPEEQVESIKKEAARWNLQMVHLDMAKDGSFDQAHELLVDGHPLLLRLQRKEWGPIKRYLGKKLGEYMGLQEWDPSAYKCDCHALVVTEYIEPKDGKPGLYKIKNSHGEDGGTFGQKGYILIENEVLRAMNPEEVFVAMTHLEIALQNQEKDEKVAMVFAFFSFVIFLNILRIHFC